MKYRKKPVIINAIQWTGENDTEVIMWRNKFEPTPIPEWAWTCDDPRRLSIPTLEGMMTAQPGDYIIRGIKGEFYPCKPDIFDATYEKVEVFKS